MARSAVGAQRPRAKRAVPPLWHFICGLSPLGPILTFDRLATQNLYLLWGAQIPYLRPKILPTLGRLATHKPKPRTPNRRPTHFSIIYFLFRGDADGISSFLLHILGIIFHTNTIKKPSLTPKILIMVGGLHIPDSGREKRKSENNGSRLIFGGFHIPDSGRGKRKNINDGCRRGGTVWFLTPQPTLVYDLAHLPRVRRIFGLRYGIWAPLGEPKFHTSEQKSSSPSAGERDHTQV